MSRFVDDSITFATHLRRRTTVYILTKFGYIANDIHFLAFSITLAETELSH